MAAVHGIIPVVDFSSHSVEKEVIPADEDASVTELAEELLERLQNTRPHYTRNVGDQFFALPPEVKNNYRRHNDDNFGWVSYESESLNPQRPSDMKEAFNMCYLPDEKQNRWPKEVPELKTLTWSFFSKCTTLAYRILKLMGLGLQLKDPEWFVKNHKLIGGPGNITTLRLLRYPPLPNKDEIKPGQVRCGEHSDYGSITLLFQDNIGGLEVLPVTGEYVAAKPLPGAVLVNIGDLMQRWTTDKLVSTKHRVLVPEEELKCQSVRRSMAFFVHPDDDVLIESLDGTNKYPPITSMDYLQQRYAVTYE